MRSILFQTAFLFLISTLVLPCRAQEMESSAPATAGEAAAPKRMFPSPPPVESATDEIWKSEKLFPMPATFPVTAETGFAERDGITPVWYEGAPYQGKATRVFAWVGIPQGAGPFPGIVLVHGGGGTAYRDWVKLWMDRGYAAVAMDTNGRIPLSDSTMRAPARVHAFAGPTYKSNGFDKAGQPPGDQWMYHAVAAVTRGHTILRSQPRVDPERIGITGISWGGVMTILAASVDTRLKCAAPVYGAGFLGEDSFWLDKGLQQTDPTLVEKWIRLWDPSQYAARIHIPMLFCNGTNDKFFRTPCWQKTYRLIPEPASVTISLQPRMQHGHPPHGDPMEVRIFIDSILKGGVPLPKVLEQGTDGNTCWARFESKESVARVRLIYTVDSGPWPARKWQESPAAMESQRATAPIPADATAWYLSLQDSRGVSVSSQHDARDKAR